MTTLAHLWWTVQGAVCAAGAVRAEGSSPGSSAQHRVQPDEARQPQPPGLHDTVTQVSPLLQDVSAVPPWSQSIRPPLTLPLYGAFSKVPRAEAECVKCIQQVTPSPCFCCCSFWLTVKHSHCRSMLNIMQEGRYCLMTCDC